MFLGWIPILGPIIDGIFASFNKYQDVSLQKYKAAKEVEIEDVKASTNIIEATKDDIGVRFARDLVIVPVAFWVALIGWDTIIALKYPQLMWHVAPFPPTVAYLPGAVLAFLLGNTALNIWRRK